MENNIGLKQLRISSVAYDIYIKEARQHKDLDRDIVEKKLTAIANNSDIIGKIGDKKVFKFGSFVMLINTNKRRIDMISWRNGLHKGYKMDKERIKALKNDYTLMGLNKKGSALLVG